MDVSISPTTYPISKGLDARLPQRGYSRFLPLTRLYSPRRNPGTAITDTRLRAKRDFFQVEAEPRLRLRLALPLRIPQHNHSVTNEKSP